VSVQQTEAGERPDGWRVTLSPANISILARPGETVVEALRRQGYRSRYKCRRGGCGVCRATLLEGEISYPAGVCEQVLSGNEQTVDHNSRPRACLPCRAVPETDVHIELGPTDRVIHVLAAMYPSKASPNIGDLPTTRKEP